MYGVQAGKRLFPSFIKDALSTSPFDLVSEAHPAPLLSKGGSSVYVIFDRTMKKFTKIKGFRSYSGGEYISVAFRTLLASTHFTYKALSQRSCPHTPQQNGVAERKHRHTIYWRQLALSCSPLLSLVNFGLKLFVLTAVYFLNRIPPSVISGLSLFERRFSTPPDYEELRVYRGGMWW